MCDACFGFNYLRAIGLGYIKSELLSLEARLGAAIDAGISCDQFADVHSLLHVCSCI
jgi:hypothetical protein